MSDPLRLLAIGLQGAGKTTFLAALWHVTESGEVPGSLRAAQLSNNAKHLNAIRNDWLRFEPAGRTVMGQDQVVTLLLTDEGAQPIGELVFPDLSGEAFEGQWADRHWSSEYQDLVRRSAGLVVFINPDSVKEPISIADLQRMSQALSPEPGEDTSASPDNQLSPRTRAEEIPQAGSGVGSGSSEARENEWSARKAPTQVQLVGLLQFVQNELPPKRPIPVTVIVSAWDRVEKLNKTPAEWLGNRMSYFDQYLRANREDFAVRVYGVSAQGGDLKSDRARLMECRLASERIAVVGIDCAPRDITEPVRWALGLRAATEA